MKRKKGGLLMIGGAVLLLAALLLTGYNLLEESRAAKSVNGILEQLAEQVPMPENGAIPDNIALPKGMIPDHILAPEMEMPTVTVGDCEYIGYLYVPSLDMELPVMSEWSYPNLKISPCRYAGSAYLDGFVICAHNYRRHFGGLKDLAIGDEVKFVDVDGNVFDYVVAEVGQLNPTDTKEMVSKDWAMSLFTCTIGGQFRVTVRCDRAE